MEKNLYDVGAKSGEVRDATASSLLSATSSLTWWAASMLAAILGFSRLSYGLLLPALRTDLHGSYTLYGLIGTLNYVGYLLGTLLMPWLLARVPNRLQLNTVALLAMSGMMLASALSPTLWLLGLWRLLIGVSSAVATVLTMALTLERIQPEERGRASGFIWMGGALGVLLSGLIAPPILSAGTTLGWRLVWCVMGLFGGASALGFDRTHRRGADVPLVCKQQEHKTMPAFERWAALRPLFQIRRLLLLTLSYCCFGAGYILYFTYVIALLEQQGLSTLNAGMIWAGIGLAGAMSGWLWGRLIDRFPNGLTLALPLALGVIGALSVLGHNALLEDAGAALMGLAAFIAPALMTTALLKRAVADSQYAASYSVLTAVFATGQILGPLLGGVIIEQVNLVAGTATSALFFILAALCAGGYGVIQMRYPVVEDLP